jgi:hypothetical protein
MSTVKSPVRMAVVSFATFVQNEYDAKFHSKVNLHRAAGLSGTFPTTQCRTMLLCLCSTSAPACTTAPTAAQLPPWFSVMFFYIKE